ncbi:integrase [Streptococcus phage Javan126]|nr:integrase [Streptococcus phage Javan126]QBX23839.1 integrase [Streptococcus phage Javan164]
MRKSFGYHMYQKTQDIAMLMEMFNHSSPDITLRYIGINQERIDDAVADFSL